MPPEEQHGEQLEFKLSKFPPAVVSQFRNSAKLLSGILNREDFDAWTQEGILIAEHSFRSWEAASEYFRVTPKVLAKLPLSNFREWARWGRTLSRESAALSTTYFHASPDALTNLAPQQVGDWAELGKGLYKGTWKSGTLSSRYFEMSPALLRYMTLGELRRLVSFIDALARRSYDLANDCLSSAEEVFRNIEKQDRRGFLSFISTLVELNWRDAKVCFESGATILSRVERDQRAQFLDIADRYALKDSSRMYSFLADSSKALGELPFETQGHLLDLAARLLGESPDAVVDLLRSSPTVLEKIPQSDLDLWFNEGLSILRDNEEGGVAYFRLESVKSKAMLEELSSGIELDKVRDVLWMYSVALAGSDVQILDTEEIKDKGIGWVSVEHPTTEGRTVYLPSFIRMYPSKDENFGWYKVVGTHQVAHLEFGSFDFSFDKESTLFPDLRLEREAAASKEGPGGVVDLERFFNLFSDRRLAYDIFTVVEDTRLDARVKHEYQGIKKTYQRTQRESIEARPPIDSLPLQEAILELLMRISLDQKTGLKIPDRIRDQVEELVRILLKVQSPASDVEDTSEATIRIYDYISQLSNSPLPPDEWEDFDTSEMDEESNVDMATPNAFTSSGAEGEGQEQEAESGQGEGEERPYQTPQEVGYRGEFKPEMVQLLARMRESQKNDSDGGSDETVSPEALRELLEKSVEIELEEAAEGDIDSSTNLFVNNLMGQISQEQPQQDPGQGHNFDTSKDEGGPLETDDFLAFLYDEWDFRANDYKPNWCCVKQRKMEEGDTGYYDRILEEYALLQAQIKKQFEMLAPEELRKVRRLPFGDDIEYDAVVDAMVEKKTGNTPTDKIYWRRNKVHRDVSVVFLLDMSASTAEAIDDAKKSAEDWSPPDDPREYLTWLRARREEGSRRSYKRIIDVEKESAVLLIRALETIGDVYGIYGFSGYGRENVEFYVIKDIDEPYSDKVKRRIDKINPLHATRMGPAIRHAISKLEKQESRTKVLFLLSDGRPQDRGYSREGVEKEYAVHDTKMALQEARRKNIVPFCLTVDRGGHDYLKTMCQDMAYEVVAEIESLPRRLPYLYRRLTV